MSTEGPFTLPFFFVLGRAGELHPSPITKQGAYIQFGTYIQRLFLQFSVFFPVECVQFNVCTLPVVQQFSVGMGNVCVFNSYLLYNYVCAGGTECTTSWIR